MKNYDKPMFIISLVILIFTSVTFMLVYLPTAWGNVRSWVGSLLEPRPVFGTISFHGGSFTGYYINNQPTNGVFTWLNGDVFEGEWISNGRVRRGTFTNENGNIFIGDAYNIGGNKISGTFTWTNGNVFHGSWSWYGDVRVRTGTETRADGTVRIGRIDDSTGFFLD